MKNSVIYSPSSSSKLVWISVFCQTQRKIFWRKFVTGCFGALLTSIVGIKNTMEVNGAPELICSSHSSEYILNILTLCSVEQRYSYRFGTTWGWVNDYIIFIFGWTIPLKYVLHPKKAVCNFKYVLVLVLTAQLYWDILHLKKIVWNLKYVQGSGFFYSSHTQLYRI